jgi:hypothetical protein
MTTKRYTETQEHQCDNCGKTVDIVRHGYCGILLEIPPHWSRVRLAISTGDTYCEKTIEVCNICSNNEPWKTRLSNMNNCVIP